MTTFRGILARTENFICATDETPFDNLPDEEVDDDREEVSSCCEAKIIAVDICSECGEHCEAELW